MLIKDNPNASKLAIPVVQRARLTVERELVKRQIRGEQIGTMSELFVPTSERTLTAKLLDGAEQFIRDYALKGYQALTPANEFVVWGPYECRGFGKTTTTANVAHLSAQGENPFPDDCDFIIAGHFLATRGKVPALPA